RADQGERSREGGAGPHGEDPEEAVDDLLPPADPSRAKDLHRAEAALLELPAAGAVPADRGDDFGLAEGPAETSPGGGGDGIAEATPRTGVAQSVRVPIHNIPLGREGNVISERRVVHGHQHGTPGRLRTGYTMVRSDTNGNGRIT